MSGAVMPKVKSFSWLEVVLILSAGVHVWFHHYDRATLSVLCAIFFVLAETRKCLTLLGVANLKIDAAVAKSRLRGHR